MAHKPAMTGKLARTISTKDGLVLQTRAEAGDYMAALPERRAPYKAWQDADAEPLTRQLEYALLLDGIVGFDEAAVVRQDRAGASRPCPNT